MSTDYQELVNKINKVYFYTRVSTEKQVKEDGQDGVGLEAQVQICSRFYQTHFENQLRMSPEIVFDVGSTFNNQNKMPNFDAMVENLHVGSLIIIVDISRLGRNVYHTFRNYEKIEQSKSFIISVSDGKIFNKSRMDDLHFFNKSVAAEAFSTEKSVNTKAIIELIRERGGHVGGVPFGMKLKRGKHGVHKLEKNPKEQMIIRKIITMYSRGIKLSDIHRSILNNPNNKYRGKPINKSLVCSIIRKYKNEQRHVSDDIDRMNI